jgi:hypothetical protein
VAVSIVRFVFFMKSNVQAPDIFWNLTNSDIWSIVELNMALVSGKYLTSGCGPPEADYSRVLQDVCHHWDRFYDSPAPRRAKRPIPAERSGREPRCWLSGSPDRSFRRLVDLGGLEALVARTAKRPTCSQPKIRRMSRTRTTSPASIADLL